ncbi:hypothetical protein F5887DRAFT_512074 [Amanita rubescens]|nr:hypothetical protein F5887DRAFT_512074 [Amanita rubescens]
MDIERPSLAYINAAVDHCRQTHFTTIHSPITYTKNLHRADMANQLPAFDGDSYQWTKALSENGVPYEVGIRKTEHSIEREREAATTHSTGNPYIREADVNWPVEPDVWKYLNAEDSKHMLISRYAVHKTGEYWFKYMIEFTNLPESGQFWFKDETGDRYSKMTSLWGHKDYALRYNSEKPTIVHVSIFTQHG